MNVTEKPVLLFDLDGTLTDPKEGITTCVQVALAAMGIEVADRDTLCPFIGPPLRKAFQEFYGLDVQQSEEAVRVYRERFAAVGKFENRVYEGVEALLQQLCDAGKRLVVATSKPEVFAREILDHFGLSRYFSFVGGALLDDSRVAKADVIAYVLADGGIAPQDAVMIGDREHDVLGAKANHLPCIGVTYGYGSEAELRAAGADAIAGDFQELKQLLMGE